MPGHRRGRGEGLEEREEGERQVYYLCGVGREMLHLIETSRNGGNSLLGNLGKYILGPGWAPLHLSSRAEGLGLFPQLLVFSLKSEIASFSYFISWMTLGKESDGHSVRWLRNIFPLINSPNSAFLGHLAEGLYTISTVRSWLSALFLQPPVIGPRAARPGDGRGRAGCPAHHAVLLPWCLLVLYQTTCSAHPFVSPEPL